MKYPDQRLRFSGFHKASRLFWTRKSKFNVNCSWPMGTLVTVTTIMHQIVFYKQLLRCSCTFLIWEKYNVCNTNGIILHNWLSWNSQVRLTPSSAEHCITIEQIRCSKILTSQSARQKVKPIKVHDFWFFIYPTNFLEQLQVWSSP